MLRKTTQQVYDSSIMVSSGFCQGFTTTYDNVIGNVHNTIYSVENIMKVALKFLWSCTDAKWKSRPAVLAPWSVHGGQHGQLLCQLSCLEGILDVKH